MERRKLTKEDIDKVRNIEGFPIGTDEDIIALSDAPFYTACPNPFIEDFIKEYGTPYDEATDNYHREPFAADVSEGKNEPIYMAHSYHTKVPYKAITKFIEHYTNPGDLVFDGFCGTGMTGVAARALGEKSFYVDAYEDNSRHAIVSDLSPVASFLASNYNSLIDPIKFQTEAMGIIDECEKEFEWMFQTEHHIDSTVAQATLQTLSGEKAYGKINYTVLSDVFICPTCGNEIVFWNAAVDHEKGKVTDEFACPHCGALLKKKDCKRAKVKVFDDALEKIVEQSKLVPVQINYSYEGKRYTKEPDENDFALLNKIDSFKIPYPYPIAALPKGDKTTDPFGADVRYVHQFYTKRTLAVLAAFAYKARGKICHILVHSVAMVNTKMYRYRWAGGFAGAGGGPLSGTLYIPSLIKDINICKSLRDYANKTIKAKNILAKFPETGLVSTQSATDLRNIPDSSCDYIFTDPPFGNNLMYSELNFIWEAWLHVVTNCLPEAIINNTQGKHLVEYQSLMTKAFSEFFRILKPNRWMTVEFHNSKNSVWNAIQTALQRSGFVVADVRTIDKKQVSFNQGKGASQAIKQDLVISAYKPRDSFRRDILDKAGTAETAWDFVRQHLANIPVVVVKNDRIEVVAERQAYLLFDRMVAYHIMQGIPVPLDATDFYGGLDEKFLKRDNMYFLPDQVNEYDTARITTEVENIQFELFVTNEKSAISWLYQQLDEQFCGPQTYAELQPKFMQEVKAVDKYEQMPELATILEENFLQDEKGRWYIPDVTKEGDLVKLREKNLWKEFEGYMNSKGKLKLFRSEAIRVGFSRLWKEKNYKAIVDIAERLPEQTIQEDSNLLMYYDISLGRV